MTKPKISIIIPVYNCKKYLGRCIDSVIMQTFNDIEIVCVNDGSTDASSQVLEEYAKRDSRIRIIHQENSGAGCARNAGLDIAQGEYIQFVDGDDYFDIDFVKKLYGKISATDSCIAFCNYRMFDDKTNKTLHVSNLPDFFEHSDKTFSLKDYPDEFFQITDPNVWKGMWKLSFIKKNGIRFSATKSVNDVFFVYASLVAADKIVFFDEVLCHYRSNISNSVTTKNMEENFKNTFIVYSDLYKYLVGKNLSNICKKTFRRRLYDSLEYYFCKLENRNDIKRTFSMILKYANLLQAKRIRMYIIWKFRISIFLKSFKQTDKIS